MRKKHYPLHQLLLTIFCMVIISWQANAQATLWGTTTAGGDSGTGTIFGVPTGGTTESTIYSFKGIPGYNPQYTTPVMSSYGVIFGVTAQGGVYGVGVLFAYDTTTGAYTDAFDFNPSTGARPFGSLVLATDGNFYGTTYSGGANNLGVIFSYNPFSKTYKDLFDFSAATGSYPSCTLIQTPTGKLYGMTYGGGANGEGVVFSFDPKTSVYKDMYDLVYSTGAGPIGSLLACPNGKLYGMTENGGSLFYGTIFSFDTITSVYKDLYDFTGTVGSNPTGNLVGYSDGLLYGMTPKGGLFSHGSFFSFDTTSNSFTPVTYFNGTTSGAYGSGSVYMSANGTLYGMTTNGGSQYDGIVFSYNHTAGFKTIYNFNGATGVAPYGSLLETTKGTFFGLTYTGGKGDGVLFKVDTLGNYKDLVDLDYASEGTYPNGSLLYMGGLLYGVAEEGGKYGQGVLYSFDPVAKVYTKLWDFDSVTGTYPECDLIEGSNGYLWGFTPEGGKYNNGTIFQYDPVFKNFMVLNSFDTLGYNPNYCGLLWSHAGTYYGTTEYGGDSTYGVLYSYDGLTNTYTDLYNFGYTVGGYPTGTMIGIKNKLFGMTSYGGANGDGSIYSFDTAAKSLKVLYNFNGTAGSQPEGNMLFTNNLLYGLTSYGGANSNGVIFSIDSSGSTYTDMHDFTNTDGTDPYGNLMQASNGKLYGLTSSGGALGGTLFEATTTGTFVKKLDFTGLNGLYPYSSLIETNLTGVNNIGKASEEVFVYPNPNQGIFTLRILSAGTIRGEISMYNMLGEKMLTQKISTAMSTIDMENSAEGVYFYRVTDEQGNELKTGKIDVVK